MKFWWLCETGRWENERQEIERISSDEPWFDLDRWVIHLGNIAAVGTIVAHGHRYAIRLIYPDQFPDVPAWVEPQENVRWSTHQYGAGGTLCLELRPDNWISTATGADVLRSARDLLLKENPLGESEAREAVMSAHHVGDIQSYGWGQNPVLMSSGCHDRLMAGLTTELVALRLNSFDDVWPIMIYDSMDMNQIRRPPGADINFWRFNIPIYVSSSLAPNEAPDRKSLIDAGGFEGIVADAIGGDAPAMVIFRGASEMIAYHLVENGTPYSRKIFVLPDQGNMRSGRKAEANTKKVAIIGAGSVGSKVAESLVRSGVGHILIVDGDVFLPGNLERHTLEWRDVGFKKVHALRRRLHEIVPGVIVDVIDQKLSWQRSAKTHATDIQRIAECDVIVDATGDTPTALYVGAIAAANKRAFVSVEVFEGGIGALIASCVPNRDPPFSKAREAFLAWCDDQAEKPPSSGIRDYESIGDDGTPLIADDAAVTTTAGHTARVVLDILDGQPAPPDSAWMLVGFKNAWVFDGHGCSIRMSVGDPPVTETPSVDPEAMAFALKLLEEWAVENSIGK